MKICKIFLPKRVHLHNLQLDFIYSLNMVTLLFSNHFQVCSCSTTTHHTIKLNRAIEQQCKLTISWLCACMKKIQIPPRWLWWTSTVPPAPVLRTKPIISRCTSSVSSTTRKQSSYSADVFHLCSTWISFRCNSPVIGGHPVTFVTTVKAMTLTAVHCPFHLPTSSRGIDCGTNI